VFNFTATISPSKQALTLTMPANTTMTANELEEFMRQLAVLRANLLPAQPDEDMNETTLYSIVPAVRWYVCPDQDAPTQIRLFLLHLGFGWIWIPLERSGASDMQAVMERCLQNLPKLQ
jgi:hypothetical protein